MTPREPTGKQRIPPAPKAVEVEAEADDGRRIRFSMPAPMPPRSRFAWPLLMALVGGGSGFGGTYAYHARMGGDHPGTQPEMIQRLDDAVARQQKLEDTVHSLELSNERVNTRLDAIHDDLTDIKALLRRGR